MNVRRSESQEASSLEMPVSREEEGNLESREELQTDQDVDALKQSEFQPEEPTAIVQQAKEKLEIDRDAYLEMYKLVVEVMHGPEDPALPELRQQLQGKRIEYLAAKKGYGQALVEAFKRRLVSQGKQGSELDEAVAEYVRTEIFQKLIVEEEKLLLERRAADYPPDEVGILKRMYQKWDSLSKVHKTLVSTIITTGLAVGVTAMAEKSSALEMRSIAMLFSKSFLVNLSQDVFTGLLGSGISKVLIDQIEKNFREEVERERVPFVLEMLHHVSGKYHQLLEKKMRQSGMAMIGTALAMVASGRAFSMGLDFLSQTDVFRNAAQATASVLLQAPDVMGRLSESETVGKPTAGIVKRILSLFGKGSDIDT